MRTRRLAAVPLALTAGVLLTAGSCAPPPDNCAGLPKPDAALVAAAAAHPEVEFETEGRNDAECILVVDERPSGDDPGAGRWTDLTDEGEG